MANASLSDPHAPSLQELWREYALTRAESIREQLLLHYLPVVKFAAQRLAARMGRRGELDDLCQWGLMGLREAIKTFDPARGVKFETYCTMRVKGAMLDGLRPLDPLPREVRKVVQTLSDAQRRFEVRHGRAPTVEELARQTGVTAARCARHLRAAIDTTPLSLYELRAAGDARPVDQLVDDSVETPDATAQRDDLKALLLRELSRTERLVLILYYYEELTMHEIGQTLGLTGTRISQIHKDILKRLRDQLQKRAASLQPRDLDEL